MKKPALRTVPIAVRMRPEERVVLERAAGKKGLGLSTYMRTASLAAARLELSR